MTNTENLNSKEQVSMTEDEVQELLGVEIDSENDKLPPIEISLETYDQDKFFQGIDDMSYFCGGIVAILNCGVTENFALNYMLNERTIAHNLETLKLSNAAQIEISKNQKMMLDKQEL